MKIVDGELRLYIHDDILGNMPEEEKLELAKNICWDDAIMTEFVEELMTGYAAPTMNSNIHNARLKFIELMPEAARDVIRALLNEISSLKVDAKRHSDWAWKMYHSWPEEQWSKCPQIQDWPGYAHANKEQADELIAKRERELKEANNGQQP